MYQNSFSSSELINWLETNRNSGDVTLPAEAILMLLDEVVENEIDENCYYGVDDYKIRGILEEIVPVGKLMSISNNLKSTKGLLKKELIELNGENSKYLDETIECIINEIDNFEIANF